MNVKTHGAASVVKRKAAASQFDSARGCRPGAAIFGLQEDGRRVRRLSQVLAAVFAVFGAGAGLAACSGPENPVDLYKPGVTQAQIGQDARDCGMLTVNDFPRSYTGEVSESSLSCLRSKGYNVRQQKRIVFVKSGVSVQQRGNDWNDCGGQKSMFGGGLVLPEGERLARLSSCMQKKGYHIELAASP